MTAAVSAIAEPLLAAALDFAQRGFPVFPCNPHTKQPLLKKDVDPNTGREIENTGGFRKATVDQTLIREWWTSWPNAMIGIPAGPRSGFWAIDPDAPERPGDPDGRSELAQLQAKHGKLPPSHTHLTPGSGKHILFKWRDDKPITNKEGGLKGRGINVRGDGGYLIFPPSKTSNGRAYQYEEALDCFNFADAPEWLYDLILTKPEPSISERAMAQVRRPDRAQPRRSAYADAALRGEIDKLSSIGRGNRNKELNNSALSLATLVAAGELSESDVVSQLIAACYSNGLIRDDGYASCIATIKSGFQHGLKFPRDIPDREDYSARNPPRMDYGPVPQETGSTPEPISTAAPTQPIKATPYVRVDPRTIEPRDWLYGHLLIRKFVTATVSPGGVGKSSLVTVEALAMASARDLLGISPRRRLRTWLWNLEDPLVETQRRIEAAAMHYGLDPEDTDGYLFVDSGRNTPLVIAKTLRNTAVIVAPVVDRLVEECLANDIDVLTIDPFVSSHEVAENDNTLQDMIIKEWGRVADRANIAVHLVDHTRKMGGMESEVTVESARGAKSKTDGCRVVRVVNRMSKDEAKEAGVENHRLYFRTFPDKGNLAPPADKSDWFKLVSVDLGNAPSGLQFGDSVGVVTPWMWPDAFADVSTDDLRAAQKAVSEGEWREDAQAKTSWVGVAIAGSLGLDIADPAVKLKVKKLLAVWTSNKMFKVVRKPDKHRNERSYVEVDQWAT